MTPNELKSNMLTNLASLKQTVQDLQHLILTQPPLNSSDFPPYTYGTMVISRERSRQIELWGIKGDEQYTNSELIQAALCYAKPPERRNINPASGNVPAGWPVSWKTEWWRPETYERDLEKAGALIAAELDRRWAARPAEVANAARVEDERRNARPVGVTPLDYYVQAATERDELKSQFEELNTRVGQVDALLVSRTRERDGYRQQLAKIASLLVAAAPGGAVAHDVIVDSIKGLQTCLDMVTRERNGFHDDLIRIAEALPLSASNDVKLVDEILIGIENLKQAVSASDEERAELIRHRDEAEAAITRLTAGLAAEESEEPTDDDDDTEVLVTVESMVESVCEGASKQLKEMPTLATVIDLNNETEVECVSRESVDGLIMQIEDELSNLLQASRSVEDSDEAVECVLAERAQCFQAAVDAINAALEYVPQHRQQTDERILAAIKTRDEFQRAIDGGSGMVEQLLHMIVSSLEMPSKADKPAEEAATTVLEEKPTRYWRFMYDRKPSWKTDPDGQIVIVSSNGNVSFPKDGSGNRVTVEWLQSRHHIVECDEHGTAIVAAAPQVSRPEACRDTFASVMLALNSLTESTGRLIQRIAALEAKP